MYRILLRHLYNSKRDPPDKFSSHLAPYMFITILLIIFPMMYFTSLWLFCNCQFVLFNPFILKIEHFSTHALAPPPPKKRKRKEDNSRKKGHSYLKKKKLHSCTDIPIVLIFFFSDKGFGNILDWHLSGALTWELLPDSGSWPHLPHAAGPDLGLVPPGQERRTFYPLQEFLPACLAHTVLPGGSCLGTVFMICTYQQTTHISIYLVFVLNQHFFLQK